MKKKTVRIALDAFMTALLPVLMAYSLVGEALHELAGTLMLALFIAHHILNRKATAAMFRGRQSPARLFGTVINLLLFPLMIALPLSGITMSKELYTFLPTEGLSYIARTLHLPLAYWGFVLMSLHFGIHLDHILPKYKAHKIGYAAVLSVLAVISVYGIYAFIQMNYIDYLLLRVQFVFFDFDASLTVFFIDHLAMIILFALTGYTVHKGFKALVDFCGF